MSGPVWKILRSPGTCDVCGEEAQELLAVGTVSDFEFRPRQRYCKVCYDRYRERHAELDPKSVAEQRVPPLISRPV